MKKNKLPATTPLETQKWVAQSWAFLKIHWLAIIVIALGTWLRVVDLPAKAIMFPDAGRDLLQAAQAVKNHELPLLGIPSSVPRFKQGPLTIWLQMGFYQLVGFDLTAYSYGFALIGIAAMVLIYETGIVFFSRRTGQLALIIMAFSPLAVAHSRMPYHTTPIPLATIAYFWGLQALAKNQTRGLFWATLTGALLFQFELSMFPVLLAIPLLWWKQRHKLESGWKQVVVGGGLGLLPQIVHDITHGFEQLGGFILWVGYRLVSLGIPGQHTLGVAKLQTFYQSLSTYMPRFWGGDVGWAQVIMAVITLSALIYGGWRWWRQRDPNLGLLLLLICLITLGYLVHGSPSEAYYPIYFVLLPLLIGVVWPKATGWFVAGTLLFLAIGWSNWQTIQRHGFFVSNFQTMSYGPSYEELLLTARAIQALKKPQLAINPGTTTPQFPSAYDSLQWAIYQTAWLTQQAPTQIRPAELASSQVLLIPRQSQFSQPANFHSTFSQVVSLPSQTLYMRTTARPNP